MVNRLASAVSPYLRAHADNPVDWWPWGDAAFAEAERRGVPVLVSIGYATCHWCHVMARESFSDPAIAAQLADGFVAVKVDREEHPDVDASYLAAASAFTPNLGWPLTVFTTPHGRAFFAGTYFPPRPMQGMPSFAQVLAAVREAWTERRDAVEQTAAAVTEALSAAPDSADAELPGDARLHEAVHSLAGHEDLEFGGFGTAPKFPVAPVLAFLVTRGEQGDATAAGLVDRALTGMAEGGLRDAVEGGFFRYAVQQDWSEPHYERMLTDNAQLLDVASRSGRHDLAEGIARFLGEVMRLPSGAFASAQNSESLVDGELSEGGYYALTAEQRAAQPRPALDTKELAGWNGLAIGALADAGVRADRPDWVTLARDAADGILASHLRDGGLLRAAAEGVASEAVATLEDVGLLAGGLLRLALATGEPAYAVTARQLVESCLDESGAVVSPAGGDPVLAARGLLVGADLSEGASPSGLSAVADAALRLHALTGDDRHRAAAERAIAPLADPAVRAPASFGAALDVLQRLASPLAQLVVVHDGADAGELGRIARGWRRTSGTLAVVSTEQARAFAEAGFELFAARTTRDGHPTAYLCEHFVCALPLTEPASLAAAIG